MYQGLEIDPVHIEEDYRNIPQTDVQRLAMALPFSGMNDGLEFQRNYYGYGSIYFQHGYYADQAGSLIPTLALKDDPSNAEALYGLRQRLPSKQEKNNEAERNV